MSEYVDTPIAQNGSDNGALVTDDCPSVDTASSICRRCGARLEAGAGRCAKCQSFVQGNQAARTHGLRAIQQPAELRQHAEELVAGIVSERDGDDALSALERSYVDKIGDLEVTIRLLTSNIARDGLLTAGGRVRDVYDKLLAGLATFDRYAQRIGLERRAKPVRTLEDVLAAHEVDANG